MSQKKGFTLVELLVVIAIIGILISLLFPAFIAVRNAARSAQCKSNIRNMALCLLAKTANDPVGAYCSGGFDGDRDGTVEMYSWVSDCVDQEVLPSQLLCPSSICKTSEKISNYMGGTSSSSKGPPGRRNAGLNGRTAALTGAEVATLLFDQGYNTNYAAGWFLARQAPLFNGAAAGGTADTLAFNLKEWWKDAGSTPVQNAVGPLTVGALDAGNVPATAIAILGCAGVGDDVDSPTGDGYLAGSIPAPYDLPAGSPACEAMNDGPTRVITGGLAAYFETGTTRAQLDNYTTLTVGNVGLIEADAGSTRQDTRDFFAYHQKTLNVCFADGSVRNVSDENGDGFINPGFDTTEGGTVSPTSADHGYLSAETEINGFEWYTGTFLTTDALDKHYEGS